MNTQAQNWINAHPGSSIVVPPKDEAIFPGRMIRKWGYGWTVVFKDGSRLRVRFGTAWEGEKNPPTEEKPEVEHFWKEDAHEGKHSPWDIIDHARPLARGITSVETPGHGGIMVFDDIARERLSTSARIRAERCGMYYCYEEDCLACIPLWELEDVRTAFFAGQKLYTPESAKATLLRSLSRWNPEYLIEIGVTPSKKEYDEWKDDRLDHEMRRNRDPNLIISASSAIYDPADRQWVPLPKGVTQVTTADRLVHYLTNYEAGRRALLLSNFKKAKRYPQGEDDDPTHVAKVIRLFAVSTAK